MFTQIGLPRAVADRSGLPYARYIQPESPMWMGFSDQQVGASGPAAICTFAGNASARFTDAVTGDYFDNGSIQHLSHDILDMLQYHDMATAASVPGADGTFVQRVQYVFHAPEIAAGDADQFTNGGGPAFLPNANRGPGYARADRPGHRHEHRFPHRRSASTGWGTCPACSGPPGPRTGRRCTSGWTGRASTPWMSRTGAGSRSCSSPSSCRRRISSRGCGSARPRWTSQAEFGVTQKNNGLERFMTATRRQNFLCPPRRHRAFPLVELS